MVMGGEGANTRQQTQSAAEEELDLASREIERLQREVKALEML